jgi:hypothetical protein
MNDFTYNIKEKKYIHVMSHVLMLWGHYKVETCDVTKLNLDT